MTVVNASTKTVTAVVIRAGDQTSHALETASARRGGRPSSCQRLKGCTVSVAATFDGGSKSDVDAFDVCKEKLIRFTD